MAFDKWTLLYSALHLLVSSIGDIDAESCGGKYSTDYGVFMSPNYPNVYDLNVECTYTISLSTMSSITFSFETFELDRSAGDYVSITCGSNSSYLQKKFYWNTNIPLISIPWCSSVRLYLYSDSYHTYTTRGFKVWYQVSSTNTTNLSSTAATTQPKSTTKTTTSTTKAPTTTTTKATTATTRATTGAPSTTTSKATTTTTKSPSTTKSTTQSPTTSATTMSVTTVETNEGICEQSDDVPFIVVTTFLVICILGYILLAAFYMFQRYRQRPSTNDAETMEETKDTNDYSTTPTASVILYENVQVQNDQSGNSVHGPMYADDANPYQNLGPVNDPQHIYENLTKQK